MISRISSGRRRSAGIAAYRWARPAPHAERGNQRRLRWPALPGWVGRLSVEVRDDRPAEREGVLVVERLVVRDAADPGVDGGAAQVLGADVLAGGRLHERRSAEEDRAGPADDHGLVAHRRDIGPSGRHEPITSATWGMAAADIRAWL